MGRQTTLGFFSLSANSYTFLKTFIGKYIDLPKDMKPAAPQQSTLGEMWGKKKKREPEAKVVQEDKMDVDRAGARVCGSKLTRFDAS